MNLKLQWLGNAGWKISSQSFSLLIDPDVENEPNRISVAEIPKDWFVNASVVLITHEHGDHFNRYTAKWLLEKSNCMFVLPPGCIQAACEIGVPDSRIVTARNGKYDDNQSVPIHLPEFDLTITPVPAVHGHILGSIYKHYNVSDCGYLISIFDKFKVFHPGDSVLLEEHFELPEVDVLMVSPTEHNMHIRQSKVLIEKLNPKYIFPQHRDTYRITDSNYFWTRAYDKDLYEVLDGKHKACYHTLAQGEVFDIVT